MEDPEPGPVLPFVLEVGETVDALVLWLSLALVIAAVAGATAVRNFRWARLERLLRSKERLERIETLVKEERAILDSLLIVRLLGSIAFLLSFLDLYEPKPGLGVGEDPLGFLSHLGLAFAIFLLVPFGLVRGLVRRRPERALILLRGFIRGCERLVLPVRLVMDAVARVFARALGLEQTEDEEEEALEEILDAVSEGEREGAVSEGERDMIENIVEFHDQAVSEVMTPRIAVSAVKEGASLDEVVGLIVEKGHSRLPVYGESIDDVLGVVYAKDVLAHWPSRNGELPSVGELMRKPLFVPESKKISDLLAEFQRDKVHFAVVLDEYGGMAGLVTIEDIVEEIIGEIEDEFDRENGEEEEVHLISEREAEVPARIHIDELNGAMNLHIPENGKYETLGGFIFSELGRVPEAGETWTWDNLRFEILDADPRRINRVKVVVGE